MTRIFNFSPGPAALPLEVLEQARDEMLDWRGTGTSVMEMSHRGKAFVSIAEQAQADLRELLAVPMPRDDPAGADASEPQTSNHPCPCCGGRMIIIETFERGSSPRYRPTAPAAAIRIDTS